MNVRDFEYIAELGRSGSILKASRALYITQPALSKFLQRVENEAGTLLFQRAGNHLVPTFAGEECIRTANEILFLNTQLENTLADIARRNRGEIRFGLPLSRGNYFISDILPKFHEHYPEMSINVFEESTRVLLKKLRSGELTMIFINVAERFSDLEYNILGQEEMILAAPESFGLSEKAFIHDGYSFPCLRPEDWESLPFIALNDDQLSHRFADDYMTRNGIKPRKFMSIRNLAQAVFAVKQGLGVTICPSMPKPEGVDYFSLYDSGTGAMTLEAGMIHRKDAYISEPEKLLMKIYAGSYHSRN